MIVVILVPVCFLCLLLNMDEDEIYTYDSNSIGCCVFSLCLASDGIGSRRVLGDSTAGSVVSTFNPFPLENVVWIYDTFENNLDINNDLV